jgi:O-antigen ligase
MQTSQIASQDRPLLLQALNGAEIAAAFICLVLFTEGLLPRLLTIESAPDSSAFLRLLWLPVYLLVGLGCLWQLPRFLSALVRTPFLVLLLAIVAASSVWSINPEVTERRAIAVIATTMAGFFLAVRYDWRSLLRLLGAVWLFMAFISLASGLIAPGFAIMDEVHPGAWRGLWWEKNSLGGHMARASFICAVLFLLDRPWRPVWGIAVMLCAALVFLSASKTALLGMVFGFGVLLAGLWMRRGVAATLSSLWLGVVVIGLAVLLLIIDPGLVFSLLGRDATLTGRTDIWSALVSAVQDRPLLGYGYGAFWGLESMPAYRVRLATEWLVPTAHNGWLETALGVGLLGLGLLMLNYLLFIGRAAWLAMQSWMGFVALGVGGQFLLFSLSESIALQQNGIVWVIYVAVAVKTALTRQAETASAPYDDVKAGPSGRGHAGTTGVARLRRVGPQ